MKTNYAFVTMTVLSETFRFAPIIIERETAAGERGADVVCEDALAYPSFIPRRVVANVSLWRPVILTVDH